MGRSTHRRRPPRAQPAVLVTHQPVRTLPPGHGHALGPHRRLTAPLEAFGPLLGASGVTDHLESFEEAAAQRRIRGPCSSSPTRACGVAADLVYYWPSAPGAAVHARPAPPRAVGRPS